MSTEIKAALKVLLLYFLGAAGKGGIERRLAFLECLLEEIKREEEEKERD